MFIAHWEWTRFEISVPRRRFGTRRELCMLLPAEGIAQSPFEAAGIAESDDWRHHRGVEFDVTINATPIERGNFGHRGTLHWKLRVDDWIDVTMVKDRGPITR
jgi:hypothetical protein